MNKKKKSAGLKTLSNLALIYASKMGSILVGVVFLPLFATIFNAEEFGFVTLIISIQALMMTMDLGMSILIGRDLSSDDKFTSLKKVTSAEIVISTYYVVILIVALSFFSDVGHFNLIFSILSFWFLTVQNINFSALNAKQKYLYNSLLQFFSALSRMFFSLIALHHINNSVAMFLFCQVAVTVIFVLLTKIVLFKVLEFSTTSSKGLIVDIDVVRALIRRGRPLMISGLSGAAVMQLDKSIITLFNNPSDLAPYFLAFSFCMIPISALATPIIQYFQPKLISSYTSKVDFNMLTIRLIQFFFIFVLMPSILVLVNIDLVISLWLSDKVEYGKVIEYASIMMPGFILGSVGYISSIFMLIAEDYRFQSRLSVVSTIFVLMLVVFFSIAHNIVWVAQIYSVYFFVTSLACTWRIFYLDGFSIQVKYYILAFYVTASCIVIFMFYLI